ncbi:DUF1631 domain-containing protein [Marinobacter sp.]|uniref:DUF1631 domain-containing protein n=1 Tax=Marinobacter sp. TaxID=50741 RepID=UPI002B458E42|nr:DUF1631 domain-containing protein [Marinobacter sp.]HKK57190.1 DUF1631 domain-containing protein [Marinobacter sp.]
MAQGSKVVNFKNQGVGQRFSLPATLVRLRDVSGQSLKAVMSEFFDQADDALFELADKAATNQDQTAYFDAMRELRLRRKHMTVSVLQYVSSAFNELGQFKPRGGTGSLDEVDQDSLSLVDHSHLEQQLAIDTLINKLRSQNAKAIRLLNVRVCHLFPDAELNDSQMPLSPEVICGGLSEACADLDIDIRAKLIVLKLFDRLLVGILDDFYHNANKTLVAEGVLPDMRNPPVGGRQRARPAAGAPGHSGETGDNRGTAAGNSGNVQGSDGPGAFASGVKATFSELSALLHGGQDEGQRVSDAGVLDADTLMARLSNIQAETASWSSNDIVPLSSQLKAVFVDERGERATAGQVDSDTINLVSMLFDFILEDRQLHSTMKAIISRLQIPVLKVALSDKNFFNRGGHPVRKLLNELALAAIGWTEKKSGQRDPLREKIESIVERVLNEYNDSVDLFTELLTDFEHFLDLDRRRRELVEQRLKDVEEARARQQRASDAAQSLLDEVREGRTLPQAVVWIMDEALLKYLQWVILREGEDSDQWHKARRLAANLAWSVDPEPVTEDTRSELLKAIPGIVDGLRMALQEISWDPFATDGAIRDLELAHVDVFQRLVTSPKPIPETATGPSAEMAPPPAPEPALVPEPEPVPAPKAASEPTPGRVSESSRAPTATADAVEPQWLERADNLRVGSWIEMTQESGKLRCKLAAFIKTTGKYIFVNRSGAKVAEYQREDLANALERGEIGMLDDGLIFDRALESIIDNLRNSRKD